MGVHLDGEAYHVLDSEIRKLSLSHKRLYKLAADVLGSDENGREWLTTASKDFGGKSPLDYADTEIGAREVEAVLERIADGVIF